MIRIVRTAELDIVEQLDRAIFAAGETAESYTAPTWWVAYDGDEPAAFAGARVLKEGALLLERAGVLPAHRGQGIQRRLIRTRCRYAWDRGIDPVITYTWRDNVVSANSLIACGFRLYLPWRKWIDGDVLYWRRDL